MVAGLYWGVTDVASCQFRRQPPRDGHPGNMSGPPTTPFQNPSKCGRQGHYGSGGARYGIGTAFPYSANLAGRRTASKPLIVPMGVCDRSCRTYRPHIHIVSYRLAERDASGEQRIIHSFLHLLIVRSLLGIPARWHANEGVRGARMPGALDYLECLSVDIFVDISLVTQGF